MAATANKLRARVFPCTLTNRWSIKVAINFPGREWYLLFFFSFFFFFCFFFFFSLRSGDGFAVDGCRARESMMQPEEEVPLVSRRTPPVPGVVADRKMR